MAGYRSEIQRVLSAHVGVECLPVCEDLDELKVVRGRRLAEQGERLDPGIAGAVAHECIEHRKGLVDGNWGSISTCVITKI